MGEPLVKFLPVAEALEHAGLVWSPEIGDEISHRKEPDSVSILVDPQGLTPVQLRETYLWLPTVEQLVIQFEARQALLFHAGLELSENTFCYKTLIHSKFGPIESVGDSLRTSLGAALRNLLMSSNAVCH